MTRYVCPSPTIREEAFKFAFEFVLAKVAIEDFAGAQRIALDWASDLARELRLQPFLIWKCFKRSLVARWFGTPEHRTFGPDWRLIDVLLYARQFSRRNVRISSFSADIACHAKSLLLRPNAKSDWKEIVKQLDRRAVIEVFPESSTRSSICFRRFGTAFSEEVIYEAGAGQAMNIWEAEQGVHPVVFVSRCENLETWRTIIPRHGLASQGSRTAKKLRNLMRHHEKSFQSKWFAMCRRTGLEGFAIEGYFEPASPEQVTVVDIDLPFDCAFMAPQ